MTAAGASAHRPRRVSRAVERYASDSATILDIAQMMRKVNPLNKLRFIWFGGEELGPLGSIYYVNNLSPTELGRIRYDLDADVTATPNYLIGAPDPAGVDHSVLRLGRAQPPTDLTGRDRCVQLQHGWCSRQRGARGTRVDNAAWRRRQPPAPRAIELASAIRVR
jgi:hypothetical protein